MKKETLIGIFLAIATIWALLFTIPKIIEVMTPPDVEVKADTVIKRDTLYYEMKKTDSIPKIKYETITKRDTIYIHSKDSDIMIPRYIQIKKKGYVDTLQMGQDTLLYEAHIEGRSYEDEDYPRLDSISFVLRGYNLKEKETITIEKIIRQKPRKWHFGAQAGYGYGFKSQKFEPYAGIGISYTF